MPALAAAGPERAALLTRRELLERVLWHRVLHLATPCDPQPHRHLLRLGSSVFLEGIHLQVEQKSERLAVIEEVVANRKASSRLSQSGQKLRTTLAYAPGHCLSEPFVIMSKPFSGKLYAKPALKYVCRFTTRVYPIKKSSASRALGTPVITDGTPFSKVSRKPWPN